VFDDREPVDEGDGSEAMDVLLPYDPKVLQRITSIGCQ